jgi:mycothiol synthase
VGDATAGEVIPASVIALAARRDAALGTLEAATLRVEALSGVLVTHRDDAHGGFGLAQIEGDRAVMRAFTYPPDARTEAEIIQALAAAVQSRKLLERGWLRIERVLRPETRGLAADVTAAYEQAGFSFFYVEHEVHRDLAALPDTPAPAGVRLVPWTAERDAEIRLAYNDAFRDRGFAGFDEDDWAGATFSKQAGFRADLSFLAVAGDTLTGFVLCEDGDEPGVGWIDTVGVRPAQRAHGIGSALILRALEAMRDAGLATAGLRVNEDNARARRVYDRLGFRPLKKHVVYRKQIG